MSGSGVDGKAMFVWMGCICKGDRRAGSANVLIVTRCVLQNAENSALGIFGGGKGIGKGWKRTYRWLGLWR